MEMTIDKAVDRLEDLHFEQDNWEHEELTEDCLLNREALRLAIDTMRKYQKIEEILKDDYEKDCGDKADFFRIGDIRMTINGESR